MPVVVRATVPASEFALDTALSQLSTAELTLERIIKAGSDSVMPLLWVSRAEPGAFLAACEGDPTVESVTLLANFDDEQLYRMEWVDDVNLVLQMMTNSSATILDAFGAERTWHLRILYPTRDELNRAHEFCHDHGVQFDIVAVRELEGEPSGRHGLTEEQYEALVRAADRGYFEIPREICLDELAAEIGISHQALSERIRRGTAALVEDTLLIGAPDTWQTQAPEQ